MQKKSILKSLISAATIFSVLLALMPFNVFASNQQTNNPPVLEPIGDKTIDELQNLSFVVNATDTEDDPLAFLISDLPVGAIFSTNTFSWTPSEAQGPSTSSVTITVSDGRATDSETIIITVNEVNVPPVAYDEFISAHPNTSRDITMLATDNDVPTTTLNFLIIGQSVNGTSTILDNHITYIPNSGFNGTDSLAFVANDGMAASNIATINITVDEHAPIIDSIPNQMATETVPFSLTATASDPDNDPLVFSIGLAPTGTAISATNATSALLTWTPTQEQGPGVYSVVIVVSDATTSDSVIFEIAVSELISSPTPSPLPSPSPSPGPEPSPSPSPIPNPGPSPIPSPSPSPSPSPLPPPPPAEDNLAFCSDGIDNDGDGLIDLADPDCVLFFPRLTVNKIVVNDNSGTSTPNDFQLFIDSISVASAFTATTTAGVHVISEATSSSYLQTAISGDCDATGTIILIIGDDKTCTITNDDIALNPTPSPLPSPIPVPSPTPSPSPLPSPPSTSNGGGGGGLGPLTFSIFQENVVDVGITKATITWTTNLFSNGKLIYDAQSRSFDWDNAPNYGYQNVSAEEPEVVTYHAITLNDLRPDTIYYVRATSFTGSNGSNKAVSRELVFRTKMAGVGLISATSTGPEVILEKTLTEEPKTIELEETAPPSVEEPTIEEAGEAANEATGSKEVISGVEDKFMPAAIVAQVGASENNFRSFLIIALLILTGLNLLETVETRRKRRRLIVSVVILALIVILSYRIDFYNNYSWILLAVNIALFLTQISIRFDKSSNYIYKKVMSQTKLNIPPISSGLLIVLLLTLGTASVSAAASTVARSFSAATPAASSTLIVSLAVDVQPPNNVPPNDSYFIDEVVPAGWNVSSSTNAGDFTTTPGHVKWGVISGAASQVNQYAISIPGSAIGTAVFSGEFAFGTNTAASSSILGQTSVNIQVPPTSPVLARISVTPATSTILRGSTKQLSAAAFDQNGTAIATTLTWASNNASVATVNAASGIVSAIGAGTAVISAASGTVSGTATITVVDPILTSISISPVSPTLSIGNSQQFNALGVNQFGGSMIPPSVSWSSGNTSISTINSSGLLIALTPGVSVITASSGGLSTTTLVTINTPSPSSVDNDSRKVSTIIRRADSEKARVARVERSAKINAPAENKSQADDMLRQANVEFSRGNFAIASRLASLAKNDYVTMRDRVNDASKRARNIALDRESRQELNDDRLAQSRIRQADRQRSSATRTAQRRGITFPQDILKRGDDLLADARLELSRGDGQESERLARGAKNIFTILKSNIRDQDKTRSEFEIELERERVESEIRNRLDDDIQDRANDIRRERRRGQSSVNLTVETKVTAEIIGNSALAKVEVKFGSTSTSTEQSIIAQEIVNRMKLTKDDVSRLLVIQNRAEDEELRERLEAKARVRTRGTEAEAKLRFPLSTTDRTSIIDGIFNRLSSLTFAEVFQAIEFRAD